MHSMTGFGSAVRETEYGRLTVEIRSVNSRFLEINLRLDNNFNHLEPQIRTALKARLNRGKVDLYVRYQPSDTCVPTMRVNRPLLESLLAQLKEVGGATEIRPESLLQIQGILVAEPNPALDEAIEHEIMAVLDEAVDGLAAERQREGEELREVLKAHGVRMRELCTEVEGARHEVIDKYRVRLVQRLEELMGPQAASLDPGRVEQEVAFFADKADITEECKRLEAHLNALDNALSNEQEGGIGRQLEFLSQEILREINTMGSKCRDLGIARAVLDMKKETESLRENIANVE